MVKSLILSLNILFIIASNLQAQQTAKCDCNDPHVQDSLIDKYLDNGAEKIPNMYNNPDWGLYCDSLIAICPNIAAAYRSKAIPFIKNGDYAKAFALEDKAVELKPQEFLSYRAFLKCIFTKDYSGAIIDFENAEKLTPGGYEMDHTYAFYEGLCNLELQNFKKAEQNFKMDMLAQNGGDDKKPLHFNTLMYVGILYFEMKEFDKAKMYLEKALALYNQLPEANYYIALIYGKEGNQALKKHFLETARQSIMDRFSMNEDNQYYANYPHQIRLFEVERELSNNN